nr:reverse transcriptase domain-containing protein [Tanacetum cinerariifolium]
MEELCQPSINGRGGPIASIPIQATDFGLRHHMIQQVQNTVSDDALHLSPFPYSLTHHAIAWYDRLPRNSIHSFDDIMRKFLLKYLSPSMVTKLMNEITKFEKKPHESSFEARERYKLSIDWFPNHNMILVTQIDTFYNGLTLSHRDSINAAAGGTFMQKTPEECYELFENMTAHHNHWDTSAIQDETSRNISSTSTTKSLEVVRQLEMMNKNFSEMMRQFQTIKDVDTKCETCGGPHSFTECPAVGGYTQETAYATTGNYNSGGTGSLPSNTVPNPRGDLKVITTQSGVTLAGPSVSLPPLSKEVDREPETITYQAHTGSTNNVPPLVIQPSPASTSFSTISSSKMPEVTKDTGGDFILEEIEACLISESIPLEINDTNLDLEGDIHLLEELLNNDPSLSHLPPKEFNVKDIKTVKSSIDEPPKLELKELPSHLEYAYLEGTDKLPVIIAKSLKDDEKDAHLKVLKSHKWAIAWKISDIKGIDPRFCIHKLLMEDDFKPTIQSQRRVNPKIHEEKTTFTCPYRTFAYRRMPFGLCNAPGTFQRCMMAIFHDMIEKTMEVFMDDFLEKCHFMVKEGIALGHKISKNRLEVDRAKVDVIANVPHPTAVKGVRSFLAHAGFYRRFIQDFSKIARPMTRLIEKETPFVFSKDCIDAFKTLKKKLTEASILVVLDWNLPFELMCDASDFVIGAVLGQRKMKHFQHIHYASKTMTEAQIHYTTMEKEMLVVVYVFEKFRP